MPSATAREGTKWGASLRTATEILTKWWVPSILGYLRALKAYIRGDEAEAKREGQAALAGYKDTSHAKPGVAAFLALVNSDAAGFDRCIEARLVTHKKQYQKTPNDPMGVMCLHCVMLCRLALDRGMAVQEGPYLPLRFLLNYTGAARK